MLAKRLGQKNAIITGASHGIGRSIALAFAQEGANLLISYKRDQEAAREVVEEAQRRGVRAHAVQVDAADPAAVDTLFERAVDFLGQVEVLVNNVGITTRTSFAEITPEQYDLVFSANLRFPFFLSQRVVRHLLARKAPGSIINVSSVSAYKAISQMAHYQCSKAGLSMLTKSLAYELAGHGIRVNTISPGLTATNGNRAQWEGDPQLWRHRGKDIPLGRAGIPEDHAGAAVFLASEESSWMTGADLVIDGGESAI